MPATEITVTSAGRVAGKEMLIPTGKEGPLLPHLQDWLSAKIKSKTALKDVSASVLVKGIKQCQNTVKEAAGIPGEFVSLVCLKQCSLAHLVHDIQN